MLKNRIFSAISNLLGCKKKLLHCTKSTYRKQRYNKVNKAWEFKYCFLFLSHDHFDHIKWQWILSTLQTFLCVVLRKMTKYSAYKVSAAPLYAGPWTSAQVHGPEIPGTPEISLIFHWNACPVTWAQCECFLHISEAIHTQSEAADLVLSVFSFCISQHSLTFKAAA